MKKLAAILFVVGGLQPGAASALSVWYGELWTPGLHAELTAPTEISNPLDLVGNADLNLLGGGFGLSKFTGTPLTITFTLAPDGYTLDSISEASVYLSVIDDGDLFQPETATLNVGPTQIASGQASFNLLKGDVSAWIDSVGDSLQLTIAGTGDFFLLGGALSVHFQGTPLSGLASPPSIPEPTAVLVFAIGLALVMRARISPAIARA
jgi:hypothetical protein